MRNYHRQNLLENLCNLEELVVEDRPEINSIVTHDVPAEDLLCAISGLIPGASVHEAAIPGLQPAHSSLMNASKLSLNLELFQITADCVMLGCEEKDT
ncbi:hypothetical protein CK203_046380 [Vitis vinifera]|uniref:Uncharacterized protein n=1 Tax=Vitis vinifera TaxID=29760 RepID=A0A438FWB4_VITVI|nr:hypothetical protein CK203_046380 [Vitis vinifera]